MVRIFRSFAINFIVDNTKMGRSKTMHTVHIENRQFFKNFTYKSKDLSPTKHISDVIEEEKERDADSTSDYHKIPKETVLKNRKSSSDGSSNKQMFKSSKIMTLHCLEGLNKPVEFSNKSNASHEKEQFLRLKSEVFPSQKSKTQDLTKLILKPKNGESESLTKFKDEEMLVLYYISIVIRLCKLSDARKAINEYSKKTFLSKRARAHLSQFKGLLAILSKSNKFPEIRDQFQNAIELYREMGNKQGKLSCNF
jgi:hypothetical protein